MSTLEIVDARRPATRGQLLRGAPGLLLLLAVVLVPLGRLVWLSLTDSGLGGSGGWVGFDQYSAVLGSSQWWATIATTAVVTGSLVLVQLVLALAFAVALWHLSLVWWPARLLALVPAGIGLVVGAQAGRAAVDRGFLATWFDLDGSGPTTLLVGVVLGELWRTTGLVVVLVHAGLSRVPAPLLDAALADGATPWQRWWRVVWPALAPALVAILVFRLLDAWRLLDGPLLVREPGSFRTTGSALVADNAFGTFATGPAAAAGVVLVVLALVGAGLTLVLARLVRAR
ncbi:carbohydrate ABC transporter permease [Aeromicrobium sp. Leaf350]|uniref:carbohydrate ABC transporter permease n=1 Tax=Aeromicrobium sp. Leaf350 TaxID=2876565 RepID=UPI001E374F32|nr:ABC transporter permease subunit [Aeromicrobium sp. Leaf350]